MKTLIFIRHAKSDWGYEFLNDIDRPLNEKGYRDTYHLSKWYKDNFPNPHIIYSSPATRAISTALIFSRALSYPETTINIVNGIYEGSIDTWLQNITNIDNKHSIAMFFGHNPTITNIANHLSGHLFFDSIPTTGIVKMDFDTTDWKKLIDIKSTKTEHKFIKEIK